MGEVSSEKISEMDPGLALGSKLQWDGDAKMTKTGKEKMKIKY